MQAILESRGCAIVPIAQEARSGSTVARVADAFEVLDRAQRGGLTSGASFQLAFSSEIGKLEAYATTRNQLPLALSWLPTRGGRRLKGSHWREAQREGNRLACG